MSDSSYIEFLGTGSNRGVPVIGCGCSNCLSEDPLDRRMRSAAIFKIRGKTLLIDAGPDIRAQLLKAGIQSIDGFFVTHDHFDHVAGFPDLVPYSWNPVKSIPTFGHPDTVEGLKTRHPYLFDGTYDNGAAFELEPLVGETGLFSCAATIQGSYFRYYQGKTVVLGVRIGKVAYLTDIQSYNDKIYSFLSGVELLVMGSPQFGRQLKNHLGLEEVVEFSEKIGPKPPAKLYITHIGHKVIRKRAQWLLPNYVSLAYDGLRIAIDDLL